MDIRSYNYLIRYLSSNFALVALLISSSAWAIFPNISSASFSKLNSRFNLDVFPHYSKMTHSIIRTLLLQGYI